MALRPFRRDASCAPGAISKQFPHNKKPPDAGASGGRNFPLLPGHKKCGRPGLYSSTSAEKSSPQLISSFPQNNVAAKFRVRNESCQPPHPKLTDQRLVEGLPAGATGPLPWGRISKISEAPTNNSGLNHVPIRLQRAFRWRPEADPPRAPCNANESHIAKPPKPILSHPQPCAAKGKVPSYPRGLDTCQMPSYIGVS